MEKIRITKEFRFEMAHALANYKGPCSNIHGHSYILYVSVIGMLINDKESSNVGMVMDFSELKSIVSKEIIEKLDHALILSDRWAQQFAENLEGYCKVQIVPYQPTCENLLLDMVSRIKRMLPKGVDLHHAKLCETATSFAEWYAEDNQ